MTSQSSKPIQRNGDEEEGGGAGAQAEIWDDRLTDTDGK
jgi:hypothetical protein